ncbi:HipA-like protein [Rheinheimera sp. A13L]|uniref:HipA domain-containing protein n=1 Tax=Rheinheimera sp. A13L TaxID=506534 RepID=UPI0002124DD7|nr:HipA domain-containing protein [Rheinheimera sp. A13L]EGM76327.1 HipA-like protein [Rheinheimera sp. A13L]
MAAFYSKNHEFVGKPAEWPVIAKHLVQNKLMSAEDADTIAVIWCFGRLIANMDMHGGNLSFYYAGEGELTVAPVYDMLSMAWPGSFGLNCLPTLISQKSSRTSPEPCNLNYMLKKI